MAADVNNTKNNDESTHLTSIDHQISILHENIKRIDLVIDQINKGDTKIFKALLSFIALVPIVVGVLSYLNFQANTAIIDKTIENSKEKLDILMRRQSQDADDLRDNIRRSIDQLNLKSSPRASKILSRSGSETIVGIPRIYQEMQGGKKQYVFELDFPLDVSVSGSGPGRFSGWSVEYNGPLIEAIMDNSDENITQRGQYNSRSHKIEIEKRRNYYIQNPITIIPGYPYSGSFRLTRSSENCYQAQKRLQTVLDITDPGSVFVSPIFEKIEENQEKTSLRIKIASPYLNFTCQ